MAGSWRRPVMRGLHAGACALLLWAGVLSAQTLTTGAVAGGVRGIDGRILGDVSITLVDAATRSTRSVVIVPGGGFEFSQLTPGEYEVLAERVGYRPKRVVGVPVRPVTRTHVEITLTPAPPPIGEAEVEEYAGVPLAGGGTREWFDARSLRAYPDLRPDLSRVGRLSSLSPSDAQLEGLPAWMTGVVVDGIPAASVRHPALPTGLRTAAFPLAFMESGELVANGVDLEWPGAAGGLLSGYTLRGSRDFQAHGYGAWSGGVGGTTSPGVQEAGAPKALEGGIMLGGPMAGDSAHVLVGVEGRRLERPLGSAWLPSAAGLAAAASQGVGVDVNPYLQSHTARSDVVSAFTRVDWQVSPMHALDLRASFASIPTSDAATDAPWAGIVPPTSVKGSDFSLGATLRSALSPSITSEVRLGLDRGTREFTQTLFGGTSTVLPAVAVVSDGVGFGSDPALPGAFTQTTVDIGAALQAQTGQHELKFGVEGFIPKYDQTYRFGAAGVVLFGDASGVSSHNGIFAQPTSAAPRTNLSTPNLGFLIQDRWSPLPGLDVVGGVRFDREQIPLKDLVRNTAWENLTGISNADFPSGRGDVSPRGGFVWDLGLKGQWVLEAGGGLFHERSDPAVIGRLFADNGSVRIRRGAGVITGWPTLTGGSTVTITAPSLTLLSAGFQQPRTGRGSAAVTFRLGGARARVAAVVRHTDFLPRETDLNQLAVQTGQDQFGRPLYGSLIQKGALVAALPGSNRRFTEFDAVTAITSDGVSDYRGVTFSVERPATKRVGFMAGYTISSSTDTWPGSGLPEVAPSILPSLGSAYAGWADATSDFDVPQRFVAGATLLGPAASRVSALFRYASGRVFTPGFAAGVDANGDGVAGNDPAYVSTDVTGTSDLLSQWSCLNTQAGRFAARNSCRGPAVKELDARIAVPLFAVKGSRAELRVDAINLLDSGPVIPDPALYVVDSAGTLSTSGGRVTVPLKANPHFGKALGYSGSGRTLLLGLALNW